MSKKEMNDETLKNVSGGELIEEKVDFYMGFIDIFKTVGLTKEDFLEAAKKEWEDNYLKFSTTGSQEDFNAFMNKLSDEYDTFDIQELIKKYENM